MSLSPDPTPDLSLVSTDDLITTLLRRNDAVLIVRMQSRVIGKTTVPLIDFSGGHVNAIGMARYADADLTDRLINPGDYEDPT